jgi:hypothetical protein
MIATVPSPRPRTHALAAKPVRRYRVPAYPRAGEPIRLDLADPRTWPFRASVTAAVIAAAGAPACDSLEGGARVGAGTSAGGTDANTTIESEFEFESESESETESETETETETETEFESESETESETGSETEAGPTPANPFTLSASHLPPSNIWGKGTPGVLPEVVAVRAVLGAFAERGVPMVVDAAYAADGVTVRLDGWNASRGIGFEFIASALGQSADGAGASAEPEDYQAPVWSQRPDGSSGPVEGPDHPERLSDTELAVLDRDLASATRHVVVINALDPRLVYPSDVGLPDDFWRARGVDNVDQAAATQRLVANIHAFLDYLAWQGVL